MSLSNGLIIFYNTNEYTVQKIFVSKMAINDLMKIIDDKYIITAGIDPKIRIWNIESEKLISKFQVHDYATVLMVCHKEYIFSYGFDMKLAKYNFKNKTLDQTVSVQNNITAIKLLKTVDETNKLKIATA
jgi:WD40 repeat protein